MTIEELGRRAVACKHWRFLPGTRIVGSNTMGRTMSLRLLNVPGSAWPDFWVAETRNANEVTFMKGAKEAGFVPDLSDPATIGCLLALVRGAWPAGEATTNVHANYSPGRGHYRQWSCYYCTGGDWRQALADTEAEALVAALEAAP